MRRLVLAVAAIFAFVAAGAQDSEGQVGLRNPVIPGFNPSPSCVVVDTNYYAVSASFQYFPGIPVYRSTDLQHWDQAGNVLTRPSQFPVAGAGISSASIRYNKGLFYVIYKNGGNYLVSAEDPAGPWSEPVTLEQKGDSPSLFFDNGKCYMASVLDGAVMLGEINIKNGINLKNARPVWRGCGVSCPEVPRIYRKDRWYYLLSSESGSIVVARSRDIYGPYEACPYNPVFTHNTVEGQGSSIRAIGQGDLFQADDESWWALMQAYRRYGGDYHFIGFETFLAPVSWAGGWPVINDGEPIKDTMAVDLPNVPEERLFGSWEYDFEQIGPEWMYLGRPESKNYQNGKNRLVLSGTGEGFGSSQPTALLMRQKSAYCIFGTSVKVTSRNGDAGIGIYQSDQGYIEYFVRKRSGKYSLVVRVRTRSILHEETEIKLNRAGADLLVRSHGDRYEFYFAGKEIARVDAALLSTEVAGGPAGVTIGPYCIQGQAEFSKFNYEEN